MILDEKKEKNDPGRRNLMIGSYNHVEEPGRSGLPCGPVITSQIINKENEG